MVKGAFNSWDRLPYLTTVRDGVTPSTIPAMNNVHHNFIVANYAADGGCLDNDDGLGPACHAQSPKVLNPNSCDLQGVRTMRFITTSASLVATSPTLTETARLPVPVPNPA